jgi:hypothetical protein
MCPCSLFPNIKNQYVNPCDQIEYLNNILIENLIKLKLNILRKLGHNLGIFRELSIVGFNGGAFIIVFRP